MALIAVRIFVALFAVAGVLAANAGAMEANTNFNGTWRGNLSKIDPGLESNALPDVTVVPESMEFALEISGDSARVFIFLNDAWVEVKPGTFGFVSHKTNGVAIAMDSYFASDGHSGWVETWNITLTAKDEDNLYAYWVRAVNNPHLADGANPNTRFFMSRMGTLQRSGRVTSRKFMQVTAPADEGECVTTETVCASAGENNGDDTSANRKIKGRR